MARSGEPDLKTLYRIIGQEKRFIAAIDRTIGRLDCDRDYIIETNQRKDDDLLYQIGGYKNTGDEELLFLERQVWQMSLNRNRDRMRVLHDAARLKAERRLTPCNIIRRLIQAKKK